MALLKHILVEILTDRTIQAGSTTSGVSFFGGLKLSTLDLPQLQQWIAFYAVVIGALGGTAALTYTILKIVRLLRNPKATE